MPLPGRPPQFRAALRGLALALALASGLAGPVAAACRQALLLGLDVSGSIDDIEYRQQLDGLAAALTDPGVTDLLLAMPAAPVALAVYEWAGRDYQKVLIDWTVIRSRDDLEVLAARLAGVARGRAPYTTGIGDALLFGRAMMDRAPVCPRQTLDISADGRSNDGPQPRSVRESGRLGNMTVNALVIGAAPSVQPQSRETGAAALAAYFRANVVHGSGAFVEQAPGYAAYGRAMRRKLLRELTVNLAAVRTEALP